MSWRQRTLLYVNESLSSMNAPTLCPRRSCEPSFAGNNRYNHQEVAGLLGFDG